MIKLFVVIFIVVGLVWAAPYAYREYTVRDALDSKDDDSSINEIFFTFTPKVPIHDVSQSVDFNLGTPIIDTRSKVEYDLGHIYSAINIPQETLSKEFPRKFPEQNIKVFVYGSSDRQAAVSVRLLRNMGYVAYYIDNGLAGWEKAGNKTDKANSSYF